MKTFSLLWLLAFLAHNRQTSAIKLYQCAEGAERNANGECVCKEGLYGRGTFCCIPNDHKMCMVEGDPVVRTMNGDIIPLELPCTTLISEVNTVGPVYDETVHIYTAGDYGSNGILNLDYIRIEYEERYNDIHTEIEIFAGQLTINGAYHDKSKPWSSQQFEVALSYSSITDTYTMRSMGTTIIHFKPPSLATDQQRSLPGVCLGVDKSSLLHDRGMCNQRRRGLQRSSINKGFKHLQTGVLEHLIRRLPVTQDVGPPKVQETCLNVNKARPGCGDKWNPAFAACFVIISNPEIRLCLAMQKFEVLEVFWNCIKAHCELDDSSCASISSKPIKLCVDIKPECSIPQFA